MSDNSCIWGDDHCPCIQEIGDVCCACGADYSKDFGNPYSCEYCATDCCVCEVEDE